MTTPRSNFVKLRLTDLEKAEWQKAAGGARKLSDWIRSVCNAAAVSDAVQADDKERVEKLVTETVQGYPARKPETNEPDRCPRWMHHRPGVYCGACKKVVAK